MTLSLPPDLIEREGGRKASFFQVNKQAMGRGIKLVNSFRKSARNNQNKFGTIKKRLTFATPIKTG